jgi:hypothetical protein
MSAPTPAPVQKPISDRMKCRFCNYTVQKWRTNSDGHRISGWRRLQAHLLEAHDRQVDLIDDPQ